MKMKKIVITGALGHIGSKLINELPLAFNDVEIVMIDNLSAQRYCSLFDLNDRGNYKFVEADVIETDLDPFVKDALAVVHLAAITNAAGSFEMKEKVEYNNFTATKQVAEACLKSKVPMLHLSSTSVYGTQKGLVDENCPEDELQPQSPYAESKIKEEKYLTKLSIESNLKMVVFRFGTIFGVSPGMRFHTAVNKFCWQAAMGLPITVWTTAYDQKRPYLDLGDAARAIIYTIKNDMFDGNIYNVLTHNLTVKEVIDVIRKRIKNLEINFVDSKIMNQLSYNVSCDKIEAKGFTPAGSIENGIFETIDMLRNANTNIR